MSRRETSPRCESWEGQTQLGPPPHRSAWHTLEGTPVPTVSPCGRANEYELTRGVSYPHPRDDCGPLSFAQFLLMAVAGELGIWVSGCLESGTMI